MDRITYISTYNKDLSPEEIQEIGRISMENNERDNLTGVLLCLKGVFYQIIEGDGTNLYECFSRIRNDPRHSDIFILNIEKNLTERSYPQWKMKTVVLDENNDPLMPPIRKLLDSLAKTHTTLKKYAPPEILEGIQDGIDPLTWGLESDEMVVLFSDLIGFSTLVEIAEIGDVQAVLDNYFEIAFSIINDSGGTISKLTGDGFMAYFPVKEATSALSASAKIIAALKESRQNSQSPFLKLSYCAIGLSAGKVVKGNIGSLIKKDYTVLGDVVNSASRLESHTRKLGHSILFDDRLMAYLSNESEFSISRLEDFTPKGKTTKLKIYTLNNPEVRFDQSPEKIAGRIRDIST